MIGQIAKITFYKAILTICGAKLKNVDILFKHELRVSRSHSVKYQTHLLLHQVIMAYVAANKS